MHEFGFRLLPHKARYVGIALIPLGFFFGYLYFFGGRPEFFETKVFAIITTYLEYRYFVFAKTNLLDELFAILTLGGLALIVFSREKREKEYFDMLRAKSLLKAAYITLIFWLVSFLLVFGWAIFAVSTVLFALYMIVYYVVFRILVRKQSTSNLG
jgi:apolipoprotein N-acyltransferase